MLVTEVRSWVRKGRGGVGECVGRGVDVKAGKLITSNQAARAKYEGQQEYVLGGSRSHSDSATPSTENASGKVSAPW